MMDRGRYLFMMRVVASEYLLEKMNFTSYFIVRGYSRVFLVLVTTVAVVTDYHRKYLYEGNSISKLQIQVATYVFELSAGNCHR
jgi:hypothetical protein